MPGIKKVADSPAFRWEPQSARRQPAYDIGHRAAQILLDRIEGVATQAETITVRLPATLKIRDSSIVLHRRDAETQR